MSDDNFGAKATPDYGSLRPSSESFSTKPIEPRSSRPAAAVVIGVLAGFLVVGVRAPVARAAWEQLSQILTLQGKPEPASPGIMSDHELSKLDNMSPQNQAQLLLERALNHYDGANDEIARRVEKWRGRLKMDSRLNSLFTTALNSNDLRVRAAAIEVDLAALGIAKTSESAARLTQQADSSDKSTRIWALWTLGLLGNRGVETQHAGEVLMAKLADPDLETRHWAVEGLAYLGADETIAPLLKTFHDDASPMVRERAACSLAQSGMLSQDQRRTAVPTLLEYAEDPSLAADTRMWVYHALRDITAQNLPNDPVAWRTWYSEHGHN